METTIICPMCNTRHRVQTRMEFPKVDGRQALELILTSQSVNVDGGKLERLVPTADDGQVLTVTGEYLSDRELLLRLVRKPRDDRAGEVAKTVQNPPPEKTAQSREDMETMAAELSMPYDPRMTDLQLAVALGKHKDQIEANAKVPPKGKAK